MGLTKRYPAELAEVPAYETVKKHLESTYTEMTRYGGIKPDGHLASWDEVIRNMDLYRSTIKHAPTEKHMVAALDAWRSYEALRVEVDTINNLGYVGPSDNLDLFLVALIGADDPKHELHKAVLQHFIWQVKRKMHGLPVSYHLMPVLVGRTGSGKSRALERFLAPLGWTIESGMDFGIFADERHWHLFGEKYVFLFDEMAKARKADVESLKNTITAKEKSYRKLHTNITITVPQKSTFIGASNDPVSSLVPDPTSARRFWEILTMPKCNWDAVNKVDCLRIWQSVDEAQEVPPILAYWDEITEIQNTYIRAKSNPELWFDECAELCADATTRASDLYEDFKEWENKFDERAKTSVRFFGIRLADIPRVRKTEKSNANYYNVRLKVADKAPLKGQDGSVISFRR